MGTSKIGAKATVKTSLFPGVKWNQVQNALNDNIKAISGDRYATDVLTNFEEQRLVEWIVGNCVSRESYRTKSQEVTFVHNESSTLLQSTGCG